MKKSLLTIAYVCASASLVLSLILFTKDDEKKSEIPEMDVYVQNENTKWGGTSFVPSDPYKADFIKIISISFATKEQDLYIKYKLGAILPKESSQMPSFNSDKLESAIFYMTLDDNYFDSNAKDSNRPEANLKMSFYGNDKEPASVDKIAVDGELVGGGPGYNYFIAKYKYSDLLLNQIGKSVVFTSYSLTTSDKYPLGASCFNFKSKLMMANQDPSEVKIALEQG